MNNKNGNFANTIIITRFKYRPTGVGAEGILCWGYEESQTVETSEWFTVSIGKKIVKKTRDANRRQDGNIDTDFSRGVLRWQVYDKWRTRFAVHVHLCIIRPSYYPRGAITALEGPRKRRLCRSPICPFTGLNATLTETTELYCGANAVAIHAKYFYVTNRKVITYLHSWAAAVLETVVSSRSVWTRRGEDRDFFSLWNVCRMFGRLNHR